MAQIIYQVDAFTDRPFCGNPAGVVILDGPVEELWMRNIAREMNLSETAFLYPVDDGFNLRWFTPAVEVDLCGHATLASAHILYETKRLNSDAQARFHTKSGLLTAQKCGDWIELNFPAKFEEPAEIPIGLVEALDVSPLYVGKNQFDYLVEVVSEDAVRSIRPNFSLLKQLPVRGTIVTARSDEGSPYDFVSRFFAPAVGIDEDPVTGSAHTCLTPYWSAKLGKADMTAFQASERGGILMLKNLGERVTISGQAVTVMTGEFVE
ncbi:MAG: PhzF family phenazine biosynthesis protein [Chloroflexi bacterium]|nr:MAG: PhzF family phenazine biosynthesis protein [Chloroflexota bacterium]